MANAIRRDIEEAKRSPQSMPMPQDYYSILMNVIEDAINDPSLVRRLVYALAWHSLNPDSCAVPRAVEQARTIVELDRALKFESAVERVEAEAARQARDLTRPLQPPAADAPILTTRDLDLSVGDSQMAAAIDCPDMPAVLSSNGDLNVQDADWIRTWPEPPKISILPRPPAWLCHPAQLGPIYPPNEFRPRLWSFMQLVGASLIGVVLYVGISGWFYLSRQPALNPGVLATLSAGTNFESVKDPHPASSGRSLPLNADSGSPTGLPFVPSRISGVYANSNGRLIELEQLAIKIPDPRALISTEITEPSRAILDSGRLVFVVSRPRLVDNTLQTATVRVVARVSRNKKLLADQGTQTQIRNTWLIRPKSYELKVSPLVGQNEMVLVQSDPDFIISAGRYVLVMDGRAYDFTVAGPVTSPDHCLEEILKTANGRVFSECRAS